MVPIRENKWTIKTFFRHRNTKYQHNIAHPNLAQQVAGNVVEEVLSILGKVQGQDTLKQTLKAPILGGCYRLVQSVVCFTNIIQPFDTDPKLTVVIWLEV